MDWKTWKYGKTFSSQGKVQGILNRLEKLGILLEVLESQEFYPKYWKSGGI